MSSPLLEVEGLTAGYDGAPAIRELDLTVSPGEVVALLGPNGAGKTTTLRALSGLLRPMRGEIRFMGQSTARVAPQLLAQRGLVHMPEGRGVFFGLTVAEHVRLLAAGGRGDPGEVYAYFPALRELRDRRAGLLSGGEQQMLALACTIARRPKLLLIDEVSLGLAPVLVERLLPMVRTYADEQQAGVVLVEQHVHLALEFADRGLVLSHGQVVLARAAQELRHDHGLVLASYLGEAASPERQPASPQQVAVSTCTAPTEPKEHRE